MKGRFDCHLCKKFYTSKSNLKIHLLKHEGTYPFECKMCPKAYASKADLTKHLKTHTPAASKQLHYCDICNKGFANKSYLPKHKRWHSNERPRVCPVCNKTFFFWTSYKIHMRGHEGERSHACRYEGCDGSFFSASDRNRHEKVKHSDYKPYECDMCQMTFKIKGYLKNHINNVHVPKERVPCKLCNKTLADKESLQSHLKRIHVGDRLHKCNKCQKAFKTVHELKQHDVVHSGIKTDCCKICGAGFTCKSNLNRHMKVHENLKKYKCSICGQGFNMSDGLRNHLQRHHLERKFQCDLCNVKLVTKFEFNNHMLTHTNEKPFLCGICSFSYKTLSGLRCHMRIHNNTMVKCEICSKKFTSRYHYKTHRKIHEVGFVNNLFRCPVCKKRYCTNRSLKRHILTHASPSNKWKCNYCIETFDSVGLLQDHQKTHNETKPFCCTDCGKLCRREASLQYHIASCHSGEGKFYCDLCGKHVIGKQGIHRHMQRHLDIQMGEYECGVCRKMFKSRTVLWKHRKRKHNRCNDVDFATQSQCDDEKDLFRILNNVECVELHPTSRAGATSEKSSQMNEEDISIVIREDLPEVSVEVNGVNLDDINNNTEESINSDVPEPSVSNADNDVEAALDHEPAVNNVEFMEKIENLSELDQKDSDEINMLLSIDDGVYQTVENVALKVAEDFKQDG